jgi:FemAB-related protein (PEP-CTERM system-associated)
MVSATVAAAAGRVAGVEVRTLAEVRSDDVNHYVASHPAASAYHSPVWLGVIERAFGHRTQYLVADSGGRIAGVLPLVFFSSRLFGRYTVSLPFVNYGGVVADSPEVEAVLLERAMAETAAAAATHLELRHSVRTFPALEARRHKVAMRLRLEHSAERQWHALDRKVRNQVRKAEKSGFELLVGGAEQLPAFYEVFARNMRDLGTPVYSIRLFEEVLAAVPASSRVFVITRGSEPVASSVVHWHGDTIEVPWASSRRELNPLCANVLLYWEMLRFAADRKFRVFDFGRSTPGEGTFHFKRQWGAEPSELVWEYWTADGSPAPRLNPANPKYGLAIRAWQRLPLPVATMLGPLVVRNIP